jgi:hypothetical protein
MTRLISAWRALTPEQRLAGGASGALFVTMFLPWYQQNAVVNAPRTAPLQSRNLNAFQVFSFVEAAVLLVALAVLYLLFARGERRSFHLPGGYGGVVFAAGIWTALLLVLRLFDKPGITSHGVAANVGIQWGIFFALAAAGLLALAGSRMRAGARSDPPLLRREARREHRDEQERHDAGYHPPPDTQVAAPATLPDEQVTVSRPASARLKQPGPRPVGSRPRYPTAPGKSITHGGLPPRRGPSPQTDAGQLSFEDTPAEPESTSSPENNPSSD